MVSRTVARRSVRVLLSCLIFNLSASALDRESLRFYLPFENGLKPDAETLLECDGAPLLVTGRYGKGRVALFTGTYLGEPREGEVFFYQWPAYANLLGRVMRWLSNTM